MLLVRALLLLVLYDILSKLCQFKTIYSMVKCWPVADKASRGNEVEQVCAAVNHACIWHPSHVLCLQRAFVTTFLLRKSGIAACMAVGAQALPFKAHAWVEVDGRPINERSDVQTEFAVWERV
jgi:hypothetical protein